MDLRAIFAPDHPVLVSPPEVEWEQDGEQLGLTPLEVKGGYVIAWMRTMLDGTATLLESGQPLPALLIMLPVTQWLGRFLTLDPLIVLHRAVESTGAELDPEWCHSVATGSVDATGEIVDPVPLTERRVLPLYQGILVLMDQLWSAWVEGTGESWEVLASVEVPVLLSEDTLPEFLPSILKRMREPGWRPSEEMEVRL